MKSIVSISLNLRLTILALFACTLLGAQAKLSLQGVLKSADGTAVSNGNYNLTFKLYNAETGGTQIYFEDMTNVPVKGGVYSAILGSTKNLDAPFDEPYWLSVTVEGQELSPRVPLTSAPTALSLIGSNNKFPSSGPVGVGATVASAALNVKGYGGATLLNVEKSDATDVFSVLQDGRAGLNAVVANTTLNVKGYGGTTLLNVEKSDNANVFTVLEDGRSGLNAVVANTTLNVKGNGGTNLLNVEKSTNADVFTVLENGTAGFNALVPTVTFNVRGASGINNAFMVERSDGTDAFLVRDNGTINVATTQEYGTLNVGSIGNGVTLGTHYYLASDGVFNGNSGFNGSAVNAQGNMLADQFNAKSDARMKTIVGRSQSSEDLKIVEAIKITDYRYIDEVIHGKRIHKKVIAQELEEVYPLAVNTSTNTVPDIYQAAGMQNGRVTLKNTLKPGERVRLLTDNKDEVLEVLAADTEGFTVRGAFSGQVFVYGREVNDFRAVDYEALTTLNISATQELLKKINRQQEQIDRQQERIGRLETQMAAVAQLLEGAPAGEK